MCLNTLKGYEKESVYYHLMTEPTTTTKKKERWKENEIEPDNTEKKHNNERNEVKLQNSGT